MDILVRIEDDICIAHGTITEVTVRDMYFINEQKTHIQYIDLYNLVPDVTLPADYEDKKYLYTELGGFEINENYVEPIYLEIYVRENRARIQVLEEDIITARDRILTLEGQMTTAISSIQDLQSRVTTLENP